MVTPSPAMVPPAESLAARPWVPPALHRNEDQLPFVTLSDGRALQVLEVDLAAGVWIVRDRFNPGTTIQTHRHTGTVYAFTQSGSWYYREYPEALNAAGSFLFEPANSQHTLTVPESNTEVTDVWFVVSGALLNLTPSGDVESVSDASTVLAAYRSACLTQHGLTDPPVVVLNEGV